MFGIILDSKTNKKSWFKDEKKMKTIRTFEC